MDRKSMDRISELSRKQRSVGLTEEERKEQACLREKYLADVRKNLKQTLDNITVVEKQQ